ncbi:acyl-CoA dehydrogenase family protein [Ferrimonas marina]|uniref:3-methylmercaptopropionyl-CoA dehydrogenase n=1 Tax=Ferrimonas marina TaxID=299255 RepID=A0A1M5NAR5_9GAMM|nr:acyl-CoA dehydrogenase family protein [Ferrimonas marina]SHG86644.1 Acyl-CoA dehydrogenase [Ferrimonas marina]
MHYQAPLDDMQFLLTDVFQAEQQWQNMPAVAEMIDMDTALAVLEEGAKITGELIAPLNRPGDEQGVRLIDGQVVTPDGYKAAFATFAEAGWVGFGGDPEFGGMGMPKMLGVLFDEMCYSASNAFALYSSLTAGAALCIASHGTEEQKALYLPKLYSGEWCGAMDMTEPQAGSDLRHVRTKAEPQEDGSYLVTGTKIFITGGDHDLSDNVVHLVLARLPDAPAGSRGLSLFIVPKRQSDEQGNLTGANGVSCGSVEHKMGITASATCVMHFDKAKGYLLGKLNRGLMAMFTMMNYERLSIGIQGLGCAQMGYQMAAAYAKERKQGQKSGGLSQGIDPILVHGDVRRMLMTSASITEAGRALAVLTGLQLDRQKYQTEGAEDADALVGLLVPLCKAFFTDLGLECSVLNQQVFGGHGYIRETGVEQLVRDVRIAQIYEGTNGIQALDLLGRKVLPKQGEALRMLMADVEVTLGEAKARHPQWAEQVNQAFAELVDAADLLRNSDQGADAVNCAANDYLHALGYATYGYLWLKMLNALDERDDEFAQRKHHLGAFYFARVFPRFATHIAAARSEAALITAMDESLF